ncbi:S-adenosylmethionine:tRNA ribosyltransferase-isomerase, partial [Bacillus thuringiensis]|uniref:S-adenosylmethionine:tRNA ribosyltransferase-isomerase n=1 Tax=Bacillus thuringiensis TaxID=1428 RepID=UPI0016428CF6
LHNLNQKPLHFPFITLHLPLPTFTPLSPHTIQQHHIHPQYYHISQDTPPLLNPLKHNPPPIITLATTSTPTLQTIPTHHDAKLSPPSPSTDIF